ncbi:hypothetical protein GS481_02915 [Rhodococcus hoagii]|nr:hypothetical protein [Prescottella equi]NKR53107.1 hypothetical protein [Prescottella equi]
MHPDHENLPLPVQQHLRRIARRKCVACAVLVLIGIALLFTPDAPPWAAATIIGAGVMGVALFGSQLMRRPTQDAND